MAECAAMQAAQEARAPSRGGGGAGGFPGMAHMSRGGGLGSDAGNPFSSSGGGGRGLGSGGGFGGGGGSGPMTGNHTSADNPFYRGY